MYLHLKAGRVSHEVLYSDWWPQVQIKTKVTRYAAVKDTVRGLPPDTGIVMRFTPQSEHSQTQSKNNLQFFLVYSICGRHIASLPVAL